MDTKTRDQAVTMARKMKAEGRNIFEQVVALRSEFRLSLEQAKEVYLEAEDGRRLSLNERQGEHASAIEADLLGLELEPA